MSTLPSVFLNRELDLWFIFDPLREWGEQPDVGADPDL